jgi:hypothetical protein
MKPRMIILSRMHWQVMVDAAENANLGDQSIIIKISNAINTASEEDLGISLWEREINELIETVSKGTVYHPDGDRYVNEVFRILRP